MIASSSISRFSQPRRWLDLVAMAGGLLIAGLSVMPILRARASYLSDIGEPEACSVWQRCPGQTVGSLAPDATAIVPWCVGLTVLIALTLPLLRRGGRRMPLDRGAVIVPSAALCATLVAAAIQSRSVGVQEQNRQFDMDPTWAWFGIAAAALAIVVAAVAPPAIDERRAG